MKNSINGAVLALLLAFAAPVPVAETLTGQEQESVCVVSRPSRTAIRQASLLRPRVVSPVDAEPPPPVPLDRGPAPRVFSADWSPPILSRPPPL